MATVCRPRDLPASVTAAFVHQVALHSPTEEQRLALLQGLSQNLPLGADVDLRRLAQLTAVHMLSDWPAQCRTLLAFTHRLVLFRHSGSCPGRPERSDCRSWTLRLQEAKKDLVCVCLSVCFLVRLSVSLSVC